MKSNVKKVIFVCEHGAGKSVVAAAYFNKIAMERNLNWQASCRGKNPDEEVSEATKEGLLADKLLDPALKPEKLTASDLDDAEKIICFTRLPDDVNPAPNTLDWTSLPNLESGYKARRDSLVKKINQLFDELAK